MKRTYILQFFTHRQVYIKKTATPPPTFSRGYARTENSKANLCQHLLHSDHNINMWATPQSRRRDLQTVRGAIYGADSLILHNESSFII